MTNQRKKREKGLLSDLLGFFTAENSALAERLADGFCSVENILGQNPTVLREIDGITNTMADFLHFLPQFFCAADYDRIKKGRHSSPTALLPVLDRLFRFRVKEAAFLILLGKKHKLLSCLKCGTGVSNMTAIDAERIKNHLVFEAKNACRIILAHNHPSGIAAPSDEDRRVYSCLAHDFKLLGVPLLDSIIYAGKTSYSFFLRGIIDKSGDMPYPEEI